MLHRPIIIILSVLAIVALVWTVVSGISRLVSARWQATGRFAQSRMLEANSDKELESCRQTSAVDMVLLGAEISDKGLGVLTSFENLKAVLFVSKANVTDSGVQNLKACEKLEVIRLVGKQITDRTMEAINEIHTLRSVDLHETSVTPAGLVHLTKLARLEELYYHGKRPLSVRDGIPEWANAISTRLPNLQIYGP